MTGRAGPVRIAFVLPDLGAGGAQGVLMRLADGLDRRRWQPRLLVLGGVQALTPPASLPTEIGTSRRVVEGLPWLVRRLRAFAPEAVVSTPAYTNFALLAAAPLLPKRTRLLVREANTPQATLQALPPWLQRLEPYRRLYPRAACVLAQTPEIRDALQDLVPGLAPRIRLLPNPVDVDALRGSKPARLPGPGLRLVGAGRLTRQKGFDRLIAMLPDLPADTRLTICGEGPERAALTAQAQALGVADRVTMPGYARDLPAQLAGADAFVITSRWEGLPNVALEALALGVPVMATPDAGLSNIATEAPDAVRIAPPGDGFVALLRDIEPGDPAALAGRPSLLPVAYRAEAVIDRLEAILDDALG
jgi:glycosyltransferase involved in cell wall biosynthesis